MRIQRSSKMVQTPFDFADQILPSDDGARNNIGMSIEILRAAVERQIKSPLGWTEVDGTGKRVIDQRDEFVRLRKLNDSFQVAHLQERIGHCLDIDGARI